MSRLLAFGCSYTFGLGLSDCTLDRQNLPSKFSWPTVLAELTNRECVNLGIPGASNKQIWYKAIDTDYNKNDVVVFLWTHIARWCTIQTNQKAISYGPWSKGKFADMYYKHFQNDFDSNVDLNLRVDHISNFLDRKNIRSYHCYAVDKEVSCLEFNKAKNMQTSFHAIRGHHGLGSDNKHPDENVHQEFAHSLYKEIGDIEHEVTL